MADSTSPTFQRDRLARACGEIAIAAILTGLISGVAPALRAGQDEPTSFPAAWLPLVSTATLTAVGVIAVLRSATVGVRSAFPDPGDRARGLTALALWMLSSVVCLAAFASVLSAVTHHRGLGGTTYAWVGLATTAVCGLVGWRLARLLGAVARRPTVAWAVFVAAGLAVCTMALAAARMDGTPGSLFVLDACAFAALAIASSRIRLPSVHQRIWIPASVVVVVLLVIAGLALAKLAPPHAPPEASQAGSASATPAWAAASANPTTRILPAAAQPPTARASAPVSRPRRIDNPDIIVVTVDTLRADHLGAYGYERKTSPHLDAFASESSVFERVYAAGPETRTAIAPLVTCKHLVESVRDSRQWPTILRANQTVAERLRAGGYSTGAVTSFQWLSKARGFSQGFDIFDERPFKRVHPEKSKTGAHTVAQAMAAYEELSSKNEPLYLWVHLFDPHDAYLGHEEFPFGEEKIDKYDSEIAYVDRQLARLFERVGQGERGSNTVWIVHGSHGEAFGEHGFHGHPPKPYDEVVRVPLLIKLPWAQPARIATPAVSVLDVPATVLSLALGESGDCSGKSLARLAEGTANQVPDRQMLLVAYDGLHGQPPAYAWLDHRVKYVLYDWREGAKMRLFDLRADPGERKNLLGERRGQAIKLRKQLDVHLQHEVRKVAASPNE